ncbi:LytR/AlgR family response regulator transcription factor [Luteimonas kalidii]|uniref:LytTR family DNA-binding domain-containing protein n=1 Tax=Luteimonas kalidii TaxID=3042025 RepID=A0ABT6JY90_9GAMM|nr:LytTR family DNA-binding domain-containing protein [Luteimonas kalidii]MDH5835673.1 LytTR family DNA-binding domain-containing protein [Luteimonas kalidii]
MSEPVPLRVAIVDDEPLARQRLARLLGGIAGVRIAGSYGDGPAALDGLGQSPVDAIFLDIRMPGLDGFQLLERLPPPRRPMVVFVSAFGERALDAFDVEAVDYLVKPLDGARVRDAVARLRARLGGRAEATAQPGVPEDATRHATRLAVPDGARLRMVEVADITMLVAQGNYVELVIAGRSLLLRETLTSLVARLDPARFVRVHRSRAVRVDLVDQVEPCGAGQYWLRLKDGSSLTSGRRYRDALRSALGLRA